MAERNTRLVILHSRAAARGAPHHMVSVIAAHLERRGVEIVHLYGASKFVPADGVLVHVDLSVVPPAYERLARKYPLQFNAAARDIRKHVFADGLLGRDDTYTGAVIVKSDLNYGGVPEYNELTRLQRGLRKLGRLLRGLPAPALLTKADYRVYPSLADVPAHHFTDGAIVQKMMLEKDGEKNLLREYMFLDDLHFENVERSASEIITEDEHLSCAPFTPHPRLIDMRRRLGLDYGKIDYVMIAGTPFIFDANKTIGMGHKAGTAGFGEGLQGMLRDFSTEIFRKLTKSRAGAVGRGNSQAENDEADDGDEILLNLN